MTRYTNTSLRDSVKLWVKDADECIRQNGHISFWDTSAVTDMSGLFYKASNFNQPLEWDTSNVTNMSKMFYEASEFNQPLEWDTSNVTDMSEMFFGAFEFKQSLNWNTFNVINKSNIFCGAPNTNNGECLNEMVSEYDCDDCGDCDDCDDRSLCYWCGIDMGGRNSQFCSNGCLHLYETNEFDIPIFYK